MIFGIVRRHLLRLNGNRNITCNRDKVLDSVFAMSCPGSRILELSRPNEGNYLNDEVVSSLLQKIKLCENNNSVAAVFVTSYSPDLFSKGLVCGDKTGVVSFLDRANNLSKAIASLQKETIAVYSGELVGTAFSLFAGCKYRLGTGLTSFSLRLFESGQISLGCGLAHHLVRGSPEGVAMARYLAVSRRSLNAHEMHFLGLLTHIVEDEPHLALIHALGHSFAENDDVKAVQNDCVDKLSVGDLLDTMDVFSDGYGRTHGTDGALAKGTEVDIMQDPIWNKIMLVRPVPVTDEDYANTSEPDAPHLCDLKEWRHEIEHCFGVDSVDECKKRLLAIKNGAPWAEHALVQLQSTPVAALTEWFRITRIAARDSLEEAMVVEKDSVGKLLSLIDSH